MSSLLPTTRLEISARTKRRRRHEIISSAASIIGCDDDDLDIEFDASGQVVFLQYDTRPTQLPQKKVDEWVFSRRKARLSQPQVTDLLPKGLSRKQLSRRTQELQLCIPVQTLLVGSPSTPFGAAVDLRQKLSRLRAV